MLDMITNPIDSMLHANIQVSISKINVFIVDIRNEPPHGKTNNLHMQKQRRRSASQ